MDALRVGRSLRALRIRRRWRQADVAARAGISRSQCSRIERGDLRGVRLQDVVAISAALGADLDVRVRWHGEGLDRLLDGAHASLVNSVVQSLGAVGWQPEVEVSFNHFGERGSIDVLAWHPEAMALLVIEVKSVVPDVQATIFGLDRKARLGPILVRDRGWEPTIVGRLLVIGDSSTSRARIAAHEFVFARALPDRGSRVRRWLREPLDPMAGIQFVRNVLPDRRTERFAGRERVRAR